MPPLSDVFFRWSSECLRCITVLVYAAPMKKPIIQRLLSFLLACVLLAQTAVGVAGWHLDIPHSAQDTHIAHCAVMEKHAAVWSGHDHSGETDERGEQHHHCCHTAPGSLAVPVASLPLPPAESATLIPAFSTEPYRNPLADLLIRPPIA